MVSEFNTLKEIQLAFSKLGHRIFRNNTAQAWAGKSIPFTKKMMVQVYPRDVLVRNAYPLRAGLCTGSSDGIGFTKDGRFLAIEIKSDKGKPTEEQISFITAVNRVGGIAFVAKSVEEAIEKINVAINK